MGQKVLTESGSWVRRSSRREGHGSEGPHGERPMGQKVLTEGAPPKSTVSLTSQRHPGKFPKVPGRRRGIGIYNVN